MNFVRFTRSFEHKDFVTGRRTRYPAGWGGEVAADVEGAARDAGTLAAPAAAERLAVIDEAASDAPINPGVTPAPHAGDLDAGEGEDDGAEDLDLDAMTKAELEAEVAARGLTAKAGASKADLVALLST